MKVSDKDIERVEMFSKKMIKEAEKRGFVPGANFTTATGLFGGKVLGDIIMKWTPDDSSEESQFSGDLVSRGFGCIYSRRSKTWGKVL